MSNNDVDNVFKMMVNHLRSIENKMDKVDNKVDRLDDRLDSVEKVAIKHDANLEAHMKRSDLLEQSQDDLKNAVKPILKAYASIIGFTKLVGCVLGIMAAITSIIKFTELF